MFDKFVELLNCITNLQKNTRYAASHPKDCRVGGHHGTRGGQLSAEVFGRLVASTEEIDGTADTAKGGENVAEY